MAAIQGGAVRQRGVALVRLILFGAALVLAFVYGMVSHRNHLQPYPLIKRIGEEYFSKPLHEPSSAQSEADVAASVEINSVEDITTKRRALVRFLWGEDALPATLPSLVVSNFIDVRYIDLGASIERLTITMEFGLESIAYHFMPKRPNGKVVIYHQGHDGDFYSGKAQISEFLSHGYAVLAFSMPLLGLNNQPTVSLPRFGKVKLTSHEHMQFLQPHQGHPVRYFLEPVVIGLNHLQRNFKYTDVSMVGISGGGWTTTLIAAIDIRVAKSFPVAGSYPVYVRFETARDWGDFEQTVPELYRTANYLELYVMGASGKHRSQLQVLNRFDSCCYAGVKWKSYRDVLSRLVEGLDGGRFDVFVDESHKGHVISGAVMKRILTELTSQARSSCTPAGTDQACRSSD